MTLRVASLCSGFGGLDLSIESVLDAELAWYAQYEPPDKNGKKDKNQHAAQIMAHHWPGVPNHGDITAVGYDQVEPVDVLTAGFPCQDISTAGKRVGLMPGTRSGLWAHVARAIRELRPSLVLLENVRSLTSARAHSDLEFCPRCMGDAGTAEPVRSLRALGAVLGDLASLGFDAEWLCLPASEIGACHKRERIFILAWPAVQDADEPTGDQRRLAASRQAEGGRPRADARGRGGAPAADADVFVPGNDGELPSGRNALRDGLRTDAPRCGTASPDAKRDGRRRGAADSAGGPDAPRIGPWAEAARRGADLDANADGGQVRQQPVPDSRGAGSAEPGSAGFEWGAYGEAVARWEPVVGRPVPRATDDRGRLSPLFVEWMMGLPAGWVTAVPGIPRNAQLKALGNGVVWQQGAAALRILLERAGFTLDAEPALAVAA